jgi:hypothetical protein
LGDFLKDYANPNSDGGAWYSDFQRIVQVLADLRDVRRSFGCPRAGLQVSTKMLKRRARCTHHAHDHSQAHQHLPRRGVSGTPEQWSDIINAQTGEVVDAVLVPNHVEDIAVHLQNAAFAAAASHGILIWKFVARRE